MINIFSTLSKQQPARRLLLHCRTFSTSTAKAVYATGPAPPRLPTKEQEEFERLQRSSRGAFSGQRPSGGSEQAPIVKDETSARLQSTHLSDGVSTTTKTIEHATSSTQAYRKEASTKDTDSTSSISIDVRKVGEELHPDIRRGAKPEFEGEVNPSTGEIGGPKNEPLRWGSTGDRGDWSYNGRVTDF